VKKWLLVFFLPLCFGSCTSVTLPLQEYTLARSALDAAGLSDAERLAPLIYQQAQELFHRAEVLYNEREFEDARLLFIKSRKLSEKAENLARLKKSKTGEVL
jgi:hypothetical protein